MALLQGLVTRCLEHERPKRIVMTGGCHHTKRSADMRRARLAYGTLLPCRRLYVTFEMRTCTWWPFILALWRDGPGVVHVVRRPGRRVRGLRRRVRLVAVEWCCWPSFGGGHYSPVRVPLMVSCSSSCLCLLAYHRVSS